MDALSLGPYSKGEVERLGLDSSHPEPIHYDCPVAILMRRDEKLVGAFLLRPRGREWEGTSFIIGPGSPRRRFAIGTKLILGAVQMCRAGYFDRFIIRPDPSTPFYGVVRFYIDQAKGRLVNVGPDEEEWEWTKDSLT